jgi:monothiol glutaredoxin
MSLDAAQQTIDKTIKENDVVLFMKGNANFPQCGFSSVVADILQRIDVDFKDVNVLLDQDIREGVKAYSDWPTIPQLYVKQEFIGGCDIVRDMYESGELAELFAEKGISCNG